MSVVIKTIAAADPSVWDRVWKDCEYSTFFHSRHWLETWVCYSNGVRANATKHVTFNDGASAIVVLSSRRRLAGLLTSYESGPRGTYGGWISDGDMGEDHARALVGYMAGLGDIAWYTNPFDPNAAVIHGAGGVHDVTDAMAFDGEFDTMFRTWSKGHRAAVKQATREGISVRVAQGSEDWQAYFGAYQDSLNRWGDAASTPYRWDMFLLLSQLPEHTVRLWLAELDGNVVAGAVCFYAKRHVVYWHGSAYAEHFKKRPVNLLVHEAARDACERGYRWFDFNPSGGLEGVRAFKTSFGTTEYACPTVRKQSAVARALNRLVKR